jgi:hypothetical protein
VSQLTSKNRPTNAAQTVRAITIQQPWPWAICYAGKRVENRRKPHPWLSAVRTPLLIHAGKSNEFMTPEAIQFCQTAPADRPFPAWAGLVKGAVVAVAWLDGVWRRELLPKEHESVFVAGPECLVLSRVVVLERPIEVNGREGIWKMPVDALTEECRRAVGSILADVATAEANGG